jgi:hypothetical protein
MCTSYLAETLCLLNSVLQVFIVIGVYTAYYDAIIVWNNHYEIERCLLNGGNVARGKFFENFMENSLAGDYA